MFFRSRVMVAVIGLVLFGGISAATAFLMSFHPAQVALVGAGQSGAATPSGTARAATPTATTAPARPATATAQPNPPSAPPSSDGGQLVDLQGSVNSVNTSASTFVVNSNGAIVTVVVTASTTFQGDAHSLSALRQGWKVQVKGTPQAGGTFLATLVDTNATDN